MPYLLDYYKEILLNKSVNAKTYILCNDLGLGFYRAGSTILRALSENFKWIFLKTLKSKPTHIKINLLHSSIN